MPWPKNGERPYPGAPKTPFWGSGSPPLSALPTSVSLHLTKIYSPHLQQRVHDAVRLSVKIKDKE